jgi:hypothetical protein
MSTVWYSMSTVYEYSRYEYSMSTVYEYSMSMSIAYFASSASYRAAPYPARVTKQCPLGYSTSPCPWAAGSSAIPIPSGAGTYEYSSEYEYSRV